MYGRRLSLALLILLLGTCLIAPPNVLGGNPWDPDSPTGGVDKSSFHSWDSLAAGDTTGVNGSPEDDVASVQPPSGGTDGLVPAWLYQLSIFFGTHLRF